MDRDPWDLHSRGQCNSDEANVSKLNDRKHVNCSVYFLLYILSIRVPLDEKITVIYGWPQDL